VCKFCGHPGQIREGRKGSESRGLFCRRCRVLYWLRKPRRDRHREPWLSADAEAEPDPPP
jgi:hypothetical protein